MHTFDLNTLEAEAGWFFSKFKASLDYLVRGSGSVSAMKSYPILKASKQKTKPAAN